VGFGLQAARKVVKLDLHQFRLLRLKGLDVTHHLIQLLETGPIEGAATPIAQDRVISGNPSTKLREGAGNETAGFFTGIWSSSEGAWRVSYEEDELCVMLEGHVRLTGTDGTVSEFKAGDAFTISRGFEGVWESVTPVRKVYAIQT
jgi:uncharacterized protein